MVGFSVFSVVGSYVPEDRRTESIVYPLLNIISLKNFLPPLIFYHYFFVLIESL